MKKMMALFFVIFSCILSATVSAHLFYQEQLVISVEQSGEFPYKDHRPHEPEPPREPQPPQNTPESPREPQPPQAPAEPQLMIYI